MKLRLTAILLLLPFYLCGQAAPDWNPTPTPSSGTVVAQILVDGLWAPPGAIIAAFDPEDHCAGASTLFAEGGITFCTLTIYGDDSSTPAVDEGMNGFEPFTLKLFLPSSGTEGVTLTWFGPDSANQLTGWTNTNGAPLPGYDDPTRVLSFHKCMPFCATDLDGNGLVAVQDLLLLLSDFGLLCSELTND